MTIWTPNIANGNRPLYQKITDHLAEDIQEGRLKPGTRLPAMRQLARHLGVTVGTVQCAYRSAEKRGLVESHIGRGTFVRTHTATSPALPQVLPNAVEDSLCDLTLNAPVSIDLGHSMKTTMETIAVSKHLDALLNYGDTRGFSYQRKIINQWLSQRGVSTRYGETILTQGGQQGLAIVFSALTRPGNVVLMEELSYSGGKNLARLQGLEIAPVAMDHLGLRPDALEEAAKRSGAQVLLCMPSAHNPTTRTMDEDRRRAICSVAKRLNLLIIEDDVYLRSEENQHLLSLQQLLPEQTFHVSSFSKTLAAGLRAGALVVPATYVSDIISAAQTSNWMSPPVVHEIICQWIESGIADDIMSKRREITRKRIELARRCFKNMRYESDLAATHMWLHLPHPWTSETFTHDLGKEGIMLTPQRYFSTKMNKHETAVRLSVGLPNQLQTLEDALQVIAKRAKRPPNQAMFGF